MIAWLIVAASLAAWAVASCLSARRAEARTTGVRPPHSWFVVVAVIAIGVAALASRATPAAAAACGLACIGLVVAGDADARSGYLFDVITLPAALLVIIAVAIAGTAIDAVWGVILLVGTFGAVVLSSGGRLMGLGDVKAMFALGAAFGPLESLVAVFAAAVSGIVAATLARRLQRGARLPFGPHLAAGSAFALVAGDHIVHRWMGL